MSKKLTTSEVERRNVLNNPYAIEEVQKAVNLQGLVFEEKLVFTKEQVASFFEVSVRTIENYLSKFEEELVENGYEVIRGKQLRDLNLEINNSDVPETDFGNINWIIYSPFLRRLSGISQNEYLVKHLNPDVKMGENILLHLFQRRNFNLKTRAVS